MAYMGQMDDSGLLTSLIQNGIDGRKEKIRHDFDAALERDFRLFGGVQNQHGSNNCI